MFDEPISLNDDLRPSKGGNPVLFHAYGGGGAGSLGVLDAVAQAVRGLTNGLVSLLVQRFHVRVTVVPFHEEVGAFIIVTYAAAGALVLVYDDFNGHEGKHPAHRTLNFRFAP